MRKENLVAMIGISTVLALSGCTSQRPSASDIPLSREERADVRDEKDTPIREQDAEVSSEEKNNSKADKNNTKADKNSTDTSGKEEKTGVVFGSPEAYGCRDFKYLTEEEISTTRNASRREEEFAVYVPKEERTRVSGASARGERAGVYVKVDLEPYLRYKAENYSLSSNLDKYVTGEMSYYDNYYDVVIGTIEETEDSAVCEVSYMEYDFYEDIYMPYYAVYGLYDLGDNVTALVTLSIDAENTTEETRALVDELSSFYQIDINWNESFAQTKRGQFEERYAGNIYELDCLSFKLPDEWEIDRYESDEYGTTYAPDGNAETEAGYLAVLVPEEAFGMVEMLLEAKEDFQEMLEEELFDEADTITITDMGMTFLGRTVKMEMSLHTESEAGYSVMYAAEDDKNLYLIYAFTPFGEEEMSDGLSEEVEEALAIFFETGRVNDRFM